MPPEVGILALVLLPLLGLFVGVYGSFAGVGGGIILTPVLSLGFGLTYPEAIACTLAQMVGMSASALFRHWRMGHIDWKISSSFLAGSIPGAIIGRLMLERIDSVYGDGSELRSAFTWFFAFLIAAGIVTAVVRLSRGRRPTAAGAAPPTRRARLRAPIARSVVLVSSGSATGALAGMLSLGGGIISLPVLVGLLGTPVTAAVSTSLLQMSFSALVATFTSLGTGLLNWPVIGLLMLGSIPGAAVGPRLLGTATAHFAAKRREAEETVAIATAAGESPSVEADTPTR